MGYQDRRYGSKAGGSRAGGSRERGRGDREFGGRQFGGYWNESRDDDRDQNSQWGRHQPRQGGDFEDRYSGRGGDEALGDESSQRGRWRGQSYGQGRYENDDYLDAGGSYGGDYGGGESRFYSPHEGPSESGRSRYGGSQHGYGDRGYGYAEGPRQSAPQRSRSNSGWREREQNQERYGQGYGSRSYANSDRYGGDYSLTGSGLTGQWDRGFSDMSQGTSGGFSQDDRYRTRSSRYGEQGSWTGGVNQPQRQSFRGKGPKGYERSDERLKEIICERLMEDPNIDASEISVEVRNREVTVTGTVEDRRTKYEVEELLEQCGGVKDVKNELRVRARSSESGDTTSPQAGSPEANYGTSGLSGISGSTGSTGSSTTRSR